MKSLLDRIADHGCLKLGAVLHLGAGACRELKGFLALNADKVALVEANPDLADQLRLRARGIKQVEVFSVAVAEIEGEAILSVTNNPRTSSIYRPAQLLKHYPNLEIARTVTVPAVTLAQLIERLSPDPSCENLMTVELQGAELAVLSSVSVESLQKFTWIAIRSSTETLYQGGTRFDVVDVMLRRSGFERMALVHPDWALPFQEALYRCDAIQLRALHTLLDERDRTVQELRQSLIEQQNENRELNQLLEQQSHLARGQRRGS